jgi:glycerophosphoryl diester phosphodiesterase
MNDTIKINKYGFKMIAHRGVSKLELENSKEAFIAAGNRTYYGVETDIRLTKDNKLVTFHDDDLKRMAGLDKLVSNLTLEELQDLILHTDYNCIKCKNRFIEYKDYLQIMKHYNKVPVIELKHGLNDETIEKVYHLTMDCFNNDINKFIFISFNFEYLLKLRKLNKNLNIQYLFGKDFDENLKKCIDNNFDLDIHYNLLTKENALKIEKAGLKLNVWTVDDINWIESHKGYKIDYITSNILE